MPKLITVFGTTGNQGGSVIQAILADPVLSKEYKICGITRDVTELTGGRLTNVAYFDSKAEIESYIRESGVRATFVLAGFFIRSFWRR
jgi:hypothetical protein